MEITQTIKFNSDLRSRIEKAKKEDKRNSWQNIVEVLLYDGLKYRDLKKKQLHDLNKNKIK